MPTIVATCCPHGISSIPQPDLSTELDFNGFAPADKIGACVVDAIHKARHAGYDPFMPPFAVIVQFE